MSNGSATWTYEYDANGMRTKRTSGSSTYEYFYTGDKLTYMTLNGVEVWFYYDASGTPYTVKFQDAYYYYTTNAQGDVTAILDSSGNRIGTYTYDAWGKPITTTAHHALTIVNPLRYRGYVYDFETELYYLQSRYYNPEVGRFLNADIYTSTGQGFLGNNMYTYCGNSPITRTDTNGESWLLVLGGIGSQYLSDVLGNYFDGKRGAEMFVPTSSMAEYCAAGITALIPGGDFGSALLRSAISESIEWVDNVLQGKSEQNNLATTMHDIFAGAATDCILGQVIDNTIGKIGSQEFGSYAKDAVERGTVRTLKATYSSWQRSNDFGRTIGAIGSKIFEVLAYEVL